MATPRNLRRTPERCMIPKNNFLFGIYGKKPLFKPFLHDSQPVFYLGFMGKRSMNPMSPINSVSASMNPMKSEAGIYAKTHCLCGFSPCVPNNLLCVGRLIINPKGSLLFCIISVSYLVSGSGKYALSTFSELLTLYAIPLSSS